MDPSATPLAGYSPLRSGAMLDGLCESLEPPGRDLEKSRERF